MLNLLIEIDDTHMRTHAYEHAHMHTWKKPYTHIQTHTVIVR